MLLLLSALAARAQAPAEVRGFLFGKRDGQPIIYARVQLKGTGLGAITDNKGYFAISRIPPGTYRLLPTALGYDTVSVALTLKAGELRTVKLYAPDAEQQLQEVEVTGTRTQQLTEVRAGVQKITPVEIKLMPSVGGEPDLAQYLQTVPGVVFTGDQGGQLYIRGGTPVQTLVLLDGMVIYNPFHSIGLFSVFDTDILRSVDVYTAGFGAQYGGRTSAVLDVTTRDGNRSRLAGKVSVNPFTSKLLLEAPIGKKGADGLAPASILISGRNSYLEQTSKVLYPYANKNGLPFNFRDIFGKVTLNGSNGARISASGFNFTDRVGLTTGSDVRWNTYGGGLDFLLLPSRSSVIMHGALAYSNYQLGISEPGLPDRSSNINGFNMNFDFTYFIGKNELKYGLNILGNSTDFNAFALLGKDGNGAPLYVPQQQQSNNTELAGFAKYRAVIGPAEAARLVLEPSLRLHYYASLAQFSLEPRVGAKFNLTERVRLKAAGGLYAQNLLETRSDRDVVNLFAGYLTSPDVLQNADGSRLENLLQKGRHLVGGVEVDLLADHLTLNVETYVKDFPVVVNINRDRLFSPAKSEFIVEQGRATGLDVSFSYRQGRLMANGNYSLTSVTRQYGDFEYRPNFDRRHNVNLLASVKLGAKKTFELSGRYNLGTGFPFTPTAGFYEQLLLGSISQPLAQQNGNLGIFYGELNSRRLPLYYRLDFSAKKTFSLSQNTKLELDASVTNATNRPNVFYFNRVTATRVNQLPILPAVGASLNF